jgi:uncharacterized protein
MMWNRTGYFGVILFTTALISNNFAGALPLKPSVQDKFTPPTQSSVKLSKKPILKSKKELISQLLEIVGGKQTYDQTQQIVLSQQKQELPKILKQMIDGYSGLTPSQKKDAYARAIQNMSSALDEFGQYMSAETTYQEFLERVYYPIYDQYFTESDLKDLVAFYKTPIGRKLISISPQLSATSQKLTFEIIMPRLSEIMGRMIQKEMDSINKLPKAPLSN